MRKNYFKILVFSLFVVASCTNDANIEVEKSTINFDKDPLSTKLINESINESVKATGKFYWKNASLQMLWSATQHGNKLVTIGFGTGANDFDKTKSPKSNQIETELLNLIANSEKTEIEKILVYKDEFLNLIDVVINEPETLELLRRNPNTRYIEPADYKYFQFESENNAYRSSSSGGSGCGFDTATLSVADYTTVTPNAKAPWTFYKHNIPSAWSYSSGAGITVGVIDTGISPNQTLMGSSFNNGLSSGRSIQKYGTYVDSIWPWSSSTDGPNDQCGHGTSMASTVAAPRNNTGMPVGVAYNANLITYRAASNVVLDGYHEQKGVQNAFTGLGNNSNVKIISMSMGHIFSVGRIEDGVRYAYARGKLIFCAGGTSTSFTTFVGVIFPAWMSETVAVTGLKDTTNYQKCDVCHSGSEIDFTVVMERSSTGNTSPVLSYYTNQSNYVGGSSVATATTAGIAALVWSKHPTWTRDQVFTKMKQSAAYYPNKNSQFGYGNVNALLAVQ
ncbi:S8 family serine peptidase [Flavobacterium gelidilacus]|jgi:subtilisin family serine protease|uniref:S8 family peptidase n=1 Tax=Flavobacterium gelidilacus TaxID=206041 RepID=UPI0004110E85|nr:S8 family serine peptidase [Flavobacterium gelidilacus]